MNIFYTSESKIYKLEGQNKTEIICGKIVKYKEALESIRRRSDWKTSGKGAAFMGAAPTADPENIYARLNGLAINGDRLVYGVTVDASASLYHRTFERTDENEGLILSSNDLSFGAFDCMDGKMAVSMGHAAGELHIAVMTPPASGYTEYTDGDTTEENPWWSRSVHDRIYFSTAGNARNEYGAVGAVSPRAGAYLDVKAGEMKEILSDEKYDYIKIKDDKSGNIYCIRQPYGGEKQESGVKFSDIILFPYRIIKGFLGWLNFMCTIWGGEALKNGGNDNNTAPGFMKAKNRSPRDIIIDGNIIKAEENAKKHQNDDDMSGLMPLSRVLLKIEADGEETVIKKGVLDYTVCPDGSLLISNGRHIISVKDGTETHIAKAYLAMNLTPFEE
ncbi:MAG: hypothetical protein K2K57_05680 [Oscillospiraceae bacterium]|nr:hypothetical protein [Oscillospiraceae bacterium]